jgi:polynucleotide 5'-hydroxyl-kinase GRC3/NOL9
MLNTGEYEIWNDAIDAIVSAGGLALVIGAPDTGKTTFCRLAALHALSQGRTVTVVDADIGQSEIGPPGCVSVAEPKEPFARMGDLQPSAMAFVGTISPRYAAMEHLAATCRAVALARASEPHLILCDTTGFVKGPVAQRLKRAKVFALRPEHLVSLSRRRSGSNASPRLAQDLLPTVHHLGVPRAIVLKPPPLRLQRREARLAGALEGSLAREWPIESVRLPTTWIGSGIALSQPACRQLAHRLKVPVRYAESRPDHLGVVAGTPPQRDLALAVARELYGASEFSVTLESDIPDLLVGLGDAHGDLLGLGRLIGIDYAARVLRVATPIHAYSLVREIRFGFVRISDRGQTLALLRPGDV